MFFLEFSCPFLSLPFLLFNVSLSLSCLLFFFFLYCYLFYLLLSSYLCSKLCLMKMVPKAAKKNANYLSSSFFIISWTAGPFNFHHSFLIYITKLCLYELKSFHQLLRCKSVLCRNPFFGQTKHSHWFIVSKTAFEFGKGCLNLLMNTLIHLLLGVYRKIS